MNSIQENIKRVLDVQEDFKAIEDFCKSKIQKLDKKNWFLEFIIVDENTVDALYFNQETVREGVLRINVDR